MIPIRWYYPTASSGPVPCAWLVRVSSSASFGGLQWVLVELVQA